jgi:hypothetical protein
MFKALSSGMFGPVVVNRRLREVWEEIDALKALIENFKGGATSEPFNWKTSEDAAALTQYALDAFGVKTKKQKAETIRAEIQALAEG